MIINMLLTSGIKILDLMPVVDVELELAGIGEVDDAVGGDPQGQDGLDLGPGCAVEVGS